jgi:hypothetical protein
MNESITINTPSAPNSSCVGTTSTIIRVDQTSSCPDEYQLIIKETNQLYFSFSLSFLLTPGNINARNKCSEDSRNLYASNCHSFDIADNHLITDFREGTVYLMYYSNSTEGVPMITDETFNQIQSKLQQADAKQAEAYIIADISLKKQTMTQKVRDIKKTYNRNNKYNIR